MELISKQQAYEVLTEYYHHTTDTQHEALRDALSRVPEAVVRCRECVYGQDDEGCWYCRILGCQIGDADGSFCSDGERRTDEPDDVFE